MDTRKSLGMVFRCISMDLGRTLTFNINFRPPPPSEGPPELILARLSGSGTYSRDGDGDNPLLYSLTMS